ncbi:hypothetical protein V6N12_038767 [Hibiscus sabdariffa]|uniref:Uncharacterized protein n=1 Tax=Hibiscus sabdariffa TaxID=183260 RepID=A0ABR2CAT4_9ROSI
MLNIDASYRKDDNGPNGSSGIDTSVGDRPNGVHFGWSDDMVDEDSYEAHKDSGDSDWLDGSFHLVVERPTAVDIPKFRRLYVCFGALKEGFKRYCTPVIGVNGCFLKGSLKGEIMSVVDRDINNQIFPITWAFVDVENRETWA